MENIIIVLLIIAIAAFAFVNARKKMRGGCCGGGSTVKIKPKDKNKAHYEYKTVAFIDGMTCENCKLRVENAFNCLPGCFARVSLKKGCAEIYAKEPLDEEKIANIIEKNGYTLVKCIN